MDTIQMVSALTLGVTFLAAYGVQGEIVAALGERWDLRPTPGLSVPAGVVFATGISTLINGLMP